MYLIYANFPFFLIFNFFYIYCEDKKFEEKLPEKVWKVQKNKGIFMVQIIARSFKWAPGSGRTWPIMSFKAILFISLKLGLVMDQG